MAMAIRILMREDNVYDAERVMAVLREAGYEGRWERVDQNADFLPFDFINLPAWSGLKGTVEGWAT